MQRLPEKYEGNLFFTGNKISYLECKFRPMRIADLVLPKDAQLAGFWKRYNEVCHMTMSRDRQLGISQFSMMCLATCCARVEPLFKCIILAIFKLSKAEKGKT